MSSVIPGLGRASLPLGDFKLDAKERTGQVSKHQACHWAKSPPTRLGRIRLKPPYSLGIHGQVAQMVMNPPATQKMWIRSMDPEDSVKEEMATYFSVLAWENPWTEEPGRLQSMGLQRSCT